MPEEKSLVMELLQDCKAKDKRNFIIIVVLIVALAVTNMSWLCFFNQFTISSTSKTDITVDGGSGPANYTEKGDINNGESH